MRIPALVLAAFLLTGVLSHDNDDPMKVNLPDDVSDGTNAISRFLGFKCPKGHRCLPVLECLPCDYGFYKEHETSDLCEMCPPSCTTLRKGATSQRECIPKCPTGFEPSDCGKTCTQCRPGYYKSNWRNKACNKCSKKYKNTIDPNRIGMTRHKQCNASQEDEPTECGNPTPPANGEVHVDSVNVGSEATVTCDAGYEMQNTDPVVCDSDGNWSDMPTCVNEGSGGCGPAEIVGDTGDVTFVGNFATVKCHDPYEPTGPSTIECSSDGEWSGQLNCAEPTHQTGACDTSECNWQDELYMANINDCQRFCQCAPQSTNTDGTTPGYWQDMVCAPGTLFNPQLNVCDHPYNVDCGAGSGGCSALPQVAGGTVIQTEINATVWCLPPNVPTGPKTIECHDGEWSGQLNCAEPSSVTGYCDATDATECNWQEDIYMANIDDCQRFCHCAPQSTNVDGTTPGYWQDMVCPTETVFNPRLNVCDHPVNVDCEAGTGTTPPPQETSPTHPTPTSDSGNGQCPTASCAVYISYVSLPGCSSFCYCDTFGTWQLMTCPTGSSFDIDALTCRSTNDVSCNADGTAVQASCPTLVADETCTLGEDVVLPGCSFFCVCETTYWSPMECQSGQYTSPGTTDCSLATVPADQCLMFDDAPTPTDGPNPDVTTPDSGTPFNQCTDETCEPDAYMALTGCQDYCHCDAARVWQARPCADGTLFDTQTSNCNTGVTCDVVDRPVEADCPPLDAEGNCLTGIRAPLAGCTQYCECEYTLWIARACSSGAFYSTTTMACTDQEAQADNCEGATNP